MLSTAMQAALLKQLNHEFFSSYVYLAMAAWCEDKGVRGFGRWMRIQAQEEMAHAMIIYRYLGDRDCRVILDTIQKPEADFGSIMEVFRAALEHERQVSRSFASIAALAQDERDFATGNFVQFFIDEQVEEEASFRDLIDQLKLVGDHGHAIFMLDREFGQRQFVLPAQLQNF